MASNILDDQESSLKIKPMDYSCKIPHDMFNWNLWGKQYILRVNSLCARTLAIISWKQRYSVLYFCLICQLWFVKEEFRSLNQILLGTRLELLNTCSFIQQQQQKIPAYVELVCKISIKVLYFCNFLFHYVKAWKYYLPSGQNDYEKHIIENKGKGKAQCVLDPSLFFNTWSNMQISKLLSLLISSLLSMDSKIYIRTFMNWKTMNLWK